ncbi:MAG: flavin reductase family protein [Hyphomicrobium sp.]|nr:flavin reductase family protein [Hyphomicrobium sp.]
MSQAILASAHQRAEVDASEFRAAMRQLAGGISAISIGSGNDISALTVTSVSSLAADPPTVIFCINRNSSSWDVLKRTGVFAVNVLSPSQQHVAERFSGRRGEKGAERYAGAEWSQLETGAHILQGALASIDCEVEELVERHTSAIVIGRVVAVRAAREAETPDSLTYWRGAYGILRG